MRTKFMGLVMVVGLLVAAAPSQASTIFTVTATAPASITQQAILGMGFSFGYFDTQIFGGCSLCLAATSGGGAPLGSYGFSAVSGPFAYLEETVGGTTQSAIAMGGSYYEHLDGYGTFDINDLYYTHVLLGGSSNYFGASIWATPGSSTATLELDLNQYATSNVVTLPNQPLYLDITGTTSTPVTLTDLTPGASPDYWAFTDPLTIDFTITLSDTPYSPSAQPTRGNTPIPEPWTWTLMLAGLAGLWTLHRGQKRKPGRFTPTATLC